MRWIILVLMGLLLLQSAMALEYVPDHFYIKYKENKELASVEAELAQTLAVKGARQAMPDAPREARKLGLDRVYIVKVEAGADIMAITQTLQKNPLIEYAHPDYYLEINEGLPNDEYFGEQWALHNTGQSGGAEDADIDWPEAYELEHGSKNVVIAVFDTGVEYTHEDLEGKFWVNPAEDLNGNGIADFYPAANGGDLDGIDADPEVCDLDWFEPFTHVSCVDDLIGYDFVGMIYTPSDCAESDCSDPDYDVSDEHGHGTRSAGQIAAATDNGVGIAGVCPECELMILKACYDNDGAGNCLLGEVTQGVFYAVSNDADVLSMSLGGHLDAGYLHDAIAYAYNSGITVVASAGNSGDDVEEYPAAWDEVIAVGATTNTDTRWSGSNYGSWVDIAAPGQNILSTSLNNNYASTSGTSRAAPFVAGVAGLLLSVDSRLSPDRIMNIITDTSDPTIGFSLETGRVNANNAVSEIIPIPGGSPAFFKVSPYQKAPRPGEGSN